MVKSREGEVYKGSGLRVVYARGANMGGGGDPFGPESGIGSLFRTYALAVA